MVKLLSLIKEITQEIDSSKIKIRRQVVNKLLVFSPHYEGDKMGAFRMKPFEDGYKITAVLLYDNYKGMGVGKKMYMYIIKTLAKEGKKLYSDDHQTAEARYVWESLVRNGYAIPTENGYVSK